MGMDLAFSVDADFSGMNGKRELSISAVIHKAFVDVSERGTEAAAATRAACHGRTAEAAPNFPRRSSRSSFLIRDNRTGSILFLGRIANPKG